MIRRLAFGGCALVAAASLTSCATFEHHDDAVRVGSIGLSKDDVGTLVGAADTTVDGPSARAKLDEWIKAILIEAHLGTANGAGDISDIDARFQADFTAFSNAEGVDGSTAYDTGLPFSSLVCLGAIPVADTTTAAEIETAITGGLTFEDAAKQYSTDATLAGNGGIVTGSDGSECVASSSLNDQITESLTGLPTGTPVTVNLSNLIAVVEIRPFAVLGAAAQAQVSSNKVLPNDVIKNLIEAADVYVDSYYGYWDQTTASILPLGSASAAGT